MKFTWQTYHSPILAFLIVGVASLGAIFFYPYASARMCWQNLTWTSNEDVMISLFYTMHPESADTIIVRHDEDGAYHVGFDHTWITAWKPLLNHPITLPFGATYPGLLYVPMMKPDAGRQAFFDSCGKFMGGLS